MRVREAITQPTDSTTYSQRGPYTFCEVASPNNQEPQYVISPVGTASTPPLEGPVPLACRHTA